MIKKSLLLILTISGSLGVIGILLILFKGFIFSVFGKELWHGLAVDYQVGAIFLASFWIAIHWMVIHFIKQLNSIFKDFNNKHTRYY